MKRLRFLLYIALAVLLCGCANSDMTEKENPGRNTTSVSAETVTDDHLMTNPGEEPHYDVYELDADNSAFNSAIQNNDIDKLYQQEINDATTTAEMIATELKYIDIWQNELDSAAANYKALLSETDAEKFELLQSQFKEYVENCFAFDADLILQNQYDIHLGTSSQWLLYVEKRETIRERTIHVKYLHYILERAQHTSSETPSGEFLQADQGETVAFNAFGLEQVVVRQKMLTDVPSNGVFTAAYVLEDARLSSHQTYLLVNTGNKFLLHNLEATSLKDNLYLCDVDGNGVQEIVLHQCVGYSGGAGNYLSRIYRVDEDTVTEIFTAADSNGSLNYDTGFTSDFLENKKLCITNNIVDYQIILDISDRYRDDFFDNSGKCTRDIHIWCDSFSQFTPEDVDNDGIFEIVCKQYVSLDGHADGIGYAKSVLKYNEETEQFVVIQAQFSADES